MRAPIDARTYDHAPGGSPLRRRPPRRADGRDLIGASRFGDDEAAEAIGRGRSRRERSASVTIEALEGRGIWLSLHGALVDGRHDRVAARLVQLAGLGFARTVLDLGGLTAVDRAGRATVLAHVESVVAAGGHVTAVDPLGVLNTVDPDLVGGAPGRLTITSARPAGTTWLAAGRPAGPVDGDEVPTTRRAS